MNAAGDDMTIATITKSVTFKYVTNADCNMTACSTGSRRVQASSRVKHGSEC
jgi:hypothetical protein